MRHHLSAIPSLLLVSILMAGCSSMPDRNMALENARTDFLAANDDPQVNQLAGEELKQAREALARADQSSNQKEPPETINHLAYLAKQKVAIAQEKTRMKRAELVVANAANERNAARLEARTTEADLARQKAESAEYKAAQATQRSQMKSEQLAVAAANAERDRADMAQMQAALSELNARTTERGLVVTFGDVLFDTNSASLKAGGMKSVQKLGEFFRQYPERRALVEGFTDSVGSASHNQILSERRANAVGRALRDMGIDGSRITTKGYGESYPVADNNTPANRHLNRRVEVVVSNEKGELPSAHMGNRAAR